MKLSGQFAYAAHVGECSFVFISSPVCASMVFSIPATPRDHRGKVNVSWSASAGMIPVIPKGMKKQNTNTEAFKDALFLTQEEKKEAKMLGPSLFIWIAFLAVLIMISGV